jgi:hypothetical protein
VGEGEDEAVNMKPATVRRLYIAALCCGLVAALLMTFVPPSITRYLPRDRAKKHATIQPALLLVPLVCHTAQRLVEEVGELVAADILILNIVLELLKVSR